MAFGDKSFKRRLERMFDQETQRQLALVEGKALSINEVMKCFTLAWSHIERETFRDQTIEEKWPNEGPHIKVEYTYRFAEEFGWSRAQVDRHYEEQNKAQLDSVIRELRLAVEEVKAAVDEDERHWAAQKALMLGSDATAARLSDEYRSLALELRELLH